MRGGPDQPRVRGARGPDPAGDPEPVTEGDATVAELAAPFSMSQPAIPGT